MRHIGVRPIVGLLLSCCTGLMLAGCSDGTTSSDQASALESHPSRSSAHRELKPSASDSAADIPGFELSDSDIEAIDNRQAIKEGFRGLDKLITPADVPFWGGHRFDSTSTIGLAFWVGPAPEKITSFVKTWNAKQRPVNGPGSLTPTIRLLPCKFSIKHLSDTVDSAYDAEPSPSIRFGYDVGGDHIERTVFGERAKDYTPLNSELNGIPIRTTLMPHGGVVLL